MSKLNKADMKHVIIVGGGIGGLAAALALERQGMSVDLLEQANEIGEIGAGIQLGPNAFAALDALGVGDKARERSVFTERIIMMDAIDAKEILHIDTGEQFRRRYGGPYAVIHRADIHLSILEKVRDSPRIRFHTSTKVQAVHQSDRSASVIDTNGNRYDADAVIGCDGVKSTVREALIGDPVRVTGHVVYRAVVDEANMPAELHINAPVLWAGPRCHLVHYPLRGSRQYNLVLTFHSRDKEEWGVQEGSKEEVLTYFSGIHMLPRQLLDCPTSWKRWATADREPSPYWGKGRTTLLGDAAHPMSQYMAQGACMALEDAVTLGAAVQRTQGDIDKAFRLYESVRIPRTSRVVWSTREMGRIYHATGVERTVRNSLWTDRDQTGFYQAMDWLYNWRAQQCLDGIRHESTGS